MSNFSFVRQAIPPLYDDCARAESYLSSDPRSACFYARRVVERLVERLYELWDLEEPYYNDLAARIGDPAFRNRASNTITQKLTALRKLGNRAVHEDRAIAPQAAFNALRELHHVMVWATFHHSPHPELAPLRTGFDPKLAARAAPLTREEVQRLARKFQAQDEEHQRALQERDEAIAARDAELAELRSQIAAAQAAKTSSDDHDYSEDKTRTLIIDLLLQEAGWPLDQPRDREYKVAGMPNKQGIGYVDYVLWGSDGRPLAVVEAKRTTSSPQIGQEQAKLYADCLEAEFGRRPVIFYTNGYEHWIWDDASGYPPRKVQGFYTQDELELMIQRRTIRSPLQDAPINKATAGRYYQERAIRAVGDAFTRRQRDALLVMATGTGKTRTTVALIEQLMSAGWVKRALFLADRKALVKQAVDAFKAHLPSVATVNLVTEREGDGRVFVSTYPTIMNLIDEVDDASRRFGPGYFDLVVIDEAHRSVYARYGAIFDWFDSLLLGLTATPKDEVDRNTYRLFHLEDGVPTDAYSLDEAVADQYLVPPRGISVGTKFLREGIRYDDLSEEEKEQWDLLDWGEDEIPDEVDAESINRFWFNEDTVDQVLGTLMSQGHKVAGGDRLGKTIIFAKNQAHAEFIERRFNAGWPEYGGRFARIITHAAPYAQSLIDSFAVADREPHIAISVDMLDTGIDVPEVVNLVFFKLVRSKTKFWQMIGRGTRLRPNLFGPDQDKQDFLVFDFCRNLEFFSQDLPEAETSVTKPLGTRIFEARLGLILALGEEEPDLRAATADILHQAVAAMNVDNFLVRPHRQLVDHYANREAWDELTREDAADAAQNLAGLPTGLIDDDEAAKRFDLLVLSRQLAQLEEDPVTAERLREKIRVIAEALLTRTAIPAVAAQAELLEEVAGEQWWQDVTLPLLELLRRRVRSLVSFIEKVKPHIVYTDFADQLTPTSQIDLPGITPGTDFKRFRDKATAYLHEHEDNITLQRLRRNRQLTAEDLSELEELLQAAGGSPADIAWAGENSGGLGLFIRSLVGLDRGAAVEAFADFLDESRYTVSQIRFVNLIIDELINNGVVDPGRLYESPYIDQAPTGLDMVFGSDSGAIIQILGDIKQKAEITGVA